MWLISIGFTPDVKAGYEERPVKGKSAGVLDGHAHIWSFFVYGLTAFAP